MTSASWKSRSRRDKPPTLDTLNLHHSSSISHQVPLTPTYISPRSPPKPPLPFQKPASSSLKGIQNVFNRIPNLNRSYSTNSLLSRYSASARSFHSDNTSIHPYATMAPAPLPVVSNHDTFDDEEECPVCLEPLSFSFRLPGEKPHIVPECGHALHEVSTSSGSAHWYIRCFSYYMEHPASFMIFLIARR
jgi:hypothetical protein